MANIEEDLMGNVIVVAIVLALMALAIRHLVRHRGSCSSCGGECGGCTHCAIAGKMVKDLDEASKKSM